MLLTAIVRDKETRKLQCLKMDYPTKERFAMDLRRNGYEVRKIGNNRDIATWDLGWNNFTEMKRAAAEWRQLPGNEHRLEVFERIAAIEL